MAAPEVEIPPWIDQEDPYTMKLYGSFYLFLCHIFFHLKLPKPTRRQKAMCLYLQRGPKRRMIQAFRGVGKTWITCIYVLWRLWKNPEEKCKIVSANEDKAIENAVFIRRLIEEVELLQPLRPKDHSRDSVLAFDVGPAGPSVSPSVKAVGITGQLTGGRATVLVADDIEVPKNSWTELMRERLAELVKEFDSLVVPEGFDIVWLGTPQTEQSIYNTVRKRGYDCRIWPARYPDAAELEKYAGSLAQDITDDIQAGARAGTSTDPERFSDIDLAEREVSYGRSGFALQFMLDTSLSDALKYPLKQRDLIFFQTDYDQAPVKLEWCSDHQMREHDLANVGFSGDFFYRPRWISPDRLPYTGCVMAIDPSGRGQDETAVVILKALNGYLYLVYAKGFKGGYEKETLNEIAIAAKIHKVNHVLVESNFGDGMWVKIAEPYFARIHPVTIEEVKVNVQKELRIISDLEPVLNQHRLVIDARVVQEDLKKAEEDPQLSLLYQLTHITKDRGSLRHDDLADALAHGVRHFRESMAIDHEHALAAHRERLREEEFRKFEMAATGVAGRQSQKWASGSPSLFTKRDRRLAPRRGRGHQSDPLTDPLPTLMR